MTAQDDFDRRIGQWLEDGPQTVPDWLVADALQEAHGVPQVTRGFGPPWSRPRRRWTFDVPKLVPLAAGAIGALAVVVAFALGLMTAPRVGIAPPSPTPTQATPVSPSSRAVPVVRALSQPQAAELTFEGADDVFALMGLATAADAVWTVAVIDSGDGQSVTSRLVRVDAQTMEATAFDVPGASGLLSPPAVDGESVWTASGGALHRLDVGSGAIVTLPVAFTPRELSVDPSGVWVATDDGTSLVDRDTGEVIRSLPSVEDALASRIYGPPAFDSLWACLLDSSIARIDPLSGQTTATIPLPAGAGQCRGRVRPFSGVAGFPDGLIPTATNVVVDPATNSAARTFETHGPWSDWFIADNQLWFLSAVGGDVGRTTLVRVDGVTGRGSDAASFAGTVHGSIAFETTSLGVVDRWFWVLSDGGGEGSAPGPTVVRLPLDELTGGEG